MTDRLLAISFFVPGEPISWARAGRSGTRSFTPKRVRVAEVAIADEFRRAFPHHIPWDGALSLHVEFFMGTGIRRDIDNQAKLVQDALNKVAYVDDSQITRLSAERRLAVGDEVAGTWIVLEPLLDYGKADGVS